MKKISTFLKDYFRHIVFVLLTSVTLSFFGWVGFSIKAAFEKYTSVPEKLDRMLEIHKRDSVRADEFMENDKQREIFFIQQLDSLKKVIREMKKANAKPQNPIRKSQITAQPINIRPIKPK